MNDDWDVVVIGGCNYDYLVRGEKIPIPGETAEGEEFQEAAGGKGANQAIGAARLGARVAFLSRIGSDSRGEACLRQLAAEGVNHSGVIRDNDFPTGVALILVDQGGRKSIMTAPGANRRVSASDIEQQSQCLERAKVVLTQLEVPTAAILEALRICREIGGATVLDPAPAVPLPDELLALVDVIRPNAAEGEVLTGIHVSDRASAKRAAQSLISRGAGAAIIQAGDDGDLVVWNEGEQWLPKLPVASIDATGAGDAFASALAVCLARGKSLADAATFANAAAALATTKLGAQAGLPRYDAVVKLLAQSGVAWN